MMEISERELFNPPHVEKAMLVFQRHLETWKMGSTPEFRKAFVLRLKQACDESRIIPPPHQGRQQMVAERIGVAPEAVSKWFKGVSMPRPDKMERLSELLQVDQSWLTFGISVEMDRQERKAHAREIDGAVHLVMGLVTLAGGMCGTPGPKDPRGSYVDFYVTMRGSVYPIHICLAREISRDRYEIVLPKEYTDVRSIAVIPVGDGKFHFLDLPLEHIEEHKARKTGAYALQISRVEPSKYMTGAAVWPRIKSFVDWT